LNAGILAGNAARQMTTADSGKARRFIPMLGALPVADIFRVALEDE